jgi:type II secretory pathway pseudopilin PulG
MKTMFHTALRPAKRRADGTTLPELMLAVGVASLVLTVVAMVSVNSSRNFAALGNYISLGQASRNGLDQMTRDIRRATNLVSFATNRLVFNWAGPTNLTYAYDLAGRYLVRSKTGEPDKILLKECDFLEFAMYKSAPQVGGTFARTTVPSEGKVISINWKCSRAILGKKMNTEDMQSAQIVIRNKPSS